MFNFEESGVFMGRFIKIVRIDFFFRWFKCRKLGKGKFWLIVVESESIYVWVCVCVFYFKERGIGEREGENRDRIF